MVTFRFYVLATAFVFVALAMGIVIGVALKEPVADGVRSRLAGVERDLDDRLKVIDAKKAEIEQLNQFAEAVEPFAVQGRLSGTSTLVLAQSGADEGVVDAAIASLQRSGSYVQGVMWVEDRWGSSSDDAVKALASATGADASNASAARSAAWAAVMTAFADQAAEQQSSAADQPVQPFGLDVVKTLAEESFLRLETVEAVSTVSAGAEPLVVVIGSSTAVLKRPAVHLESAVQAASKSSLRTVATEIDQDVVDPDRGALLKAIVDDDLDRVSTVDDLDLQIGRVALVLALDAAQEDRRGHYGVGPDADGPLPDWLAGTS